MCYYSLCWKGTARKFATQHQLGLSKKILCFHVAKGVANMVAVKVEGTKFKSWPVKPLLHWKTYP